jgi:hypothetical protein
MECPAKWCASGSYGTRLVASIPGVKRHVKKVHPSEYARVSWPDIYGRVSMGGFRTLPEDHLSRKSLNELRQIAKGRGVSSLGKSKKALAIELLNMDLAASRPSKPDEPREDAGP